MTIHTTAGALDREDLDSTVTVELPGNSRWTGRLTGLNHGPDHMVRLVVDRRHLIISRSTDVTIH